MQLERIEFERVGGIANMRIAADFEADDLSDEQLRTLSDLLDDLDFSELPEKLFGDNAMPDQFTYTVTVHAKDWRHTVVTGDMSADEKMRELLEFLYGLARSKMRNK